MKFRCTKFPYVGALSALLLSTLPLVSALNTAYAADKTLVIKYSLGADKPIIRSKEYRQLDVPTDTHLTTVELVHMDSLGPDAHEVHVATLQQEDRLSRDDSGLIRLSSDNRGLQVPQRVEIIEPAESESWFFVYYNHNALAESLGTRSVSPSESAFQLITPEGDVFLGDDSEEVTPEIELQLKRYHRINSGLVHSLFALMSADELADLVVRAYLYPTYYPHQISPLRVPESVHVESDETSGPATNPQRAASVYPDSAASASSATPAGRSSMYSAMGFDYPASTLMMTPGTISPSVFSSAPAPAFGDRLDSQSYGADMAIVPVCRAHNRAQSDTYHFSPDPLLTQAPEGIYRLHSLSMEVDAELQAIHLGHIPSAIGEISRLQSSGTEVLTARRLSVESPQADLNSQPQSSVQPAPAPAPVVIHLAVPEPRRSAVCAPGSVGNLTPQQAAQVNEACKPKPLCGGCNIM